MPNIIFKNISKYYDKNNNVIALDNINIDICENSFVALIGPSGSGKTTLLRILSGLENPSSGEIIVDDDIYFSKEKSINKNIIDRKCGFVFQNYALWPYMTVYENIAFGLKKDNKINIKNKVNDIAKQVKVDKLLYRYPYELSGGEKQRVAFARTLATNPSILLLDEPFANLDINLKLQLQEEILDLQKETKKTFIYVTHDINDAMSIATHICILNNGKCEQFDKTFEIYNKPNNIFVSNLICENNISFIKVKFLRNDNDMAEILLFNNYNIKFKIDEKIDFNNFNDLILGIKINDLEITNDTKNIINGKICSIKNNILFYIITILVGNEEIKIFSNDNINYKIGDNINFKLKDNIFSLYNQNKRITNCKIIF